VGAGTNPFDPADDTGLPPVGFLVINEIDYDQTGTDLGEFIEIYNPSTAPVPLGDLAVVLVNGSGGAEYGRYLLGPVAPVLAPGAFLVIAHPSVILPPGTLNIALPAAGNAIQNGAPDGVALVSLATNTVLDALSYEGSMTAAIITGFLGPVNLVEGTPFAGADTNDNLNTVARIPNGFGLEQRRGGLGALAGDHAGRAEPLRSVGLSSGRAGLRPARVGVVEGRAPVALAPTAGSAALAGRLLPCPRRLGGEQGPRVLEELRGEEAVDRLAHLGVERFAGDRSGPDLPGLVEDRDGIPRGPSWWRGRRRA
jgi:hypothetical protein